MSDQDKKRATDRWAEALAWYGTLDTADEKRLTSTVGGAWQEWYADARNRQIFDDVSRLLAERRLYRDRTRPSKAELEQDEYDLSVPIAEWRNAHLPNQTRRQRAPVAKWWWLSGGLATTAILVLIVLSSQWIRMHGSRSAPAVYETGLGGLEEAHLPDGSTITLGGRTRLLVAFSAQHRTANLIEGQAWFKVAHDPHWPFIVTAGDGTIKDVGTSFLVTRESDRVVVTVTAGVVEVSARAPPPSASASSRRDQTPAAKRVLAPIRVSGGQELALGDNGALTDIKLSDTRAATEWTHGRLTFDNQPLRYVIETVDRYSSRRIVVSPEAGELRFSGIVFNNEIEDWLVSLQAIFPVTVEESSAVVRIRMSSSSRATR